MHLLGGPPADAVLFSISPNPLRHDRLVSLVDAVANGLSDRRIVHGKALEAIPIEGFQPSPYVAVVVQSRLHVEVKR